MTSSIPKSGEALPHYVSTAPFDPSLIEPNTSGMAAFSKASQLKLMWWQFRQHKIAVWSGAFLALIYLSILISEFLALTIFIPAISSISTRRRRLSTSSTTENLSVPSFMAGK